MNAQFLLVHIRGVYLFLLLLLLVFLRWLRFAFLDEQLGVRNLVNNRL